MGDVIASELQGGLAANAGLGILREWSEAVDFFKDAQVALGAFNGFEAAEVLIVLVKAADDKFCGVVRGRNFVTADGIDQLGPVEYQEVKDDGGGWGGLGVSIFEGEDLLVAEERFGRGLGVEDVVDELFELLGFGVVLGVVGAVNIFDVFLDVLQGVEDAQVMGGRGEDLRDDGAVILAQIGDDDGGVVAFGA